MILTSKPMGIYVLKNRPAFLLIIMRDPEEYMSLTHNMAFNLQAVITRFIEQINK